MYMKIVLSFLLLLILSGCSLEDKFYILSTASTPKKNYRLNYKSLGVEKIVVPKYLFKREIAIANSTSQVTFLKRAYWAEELDEGLTNRMISFLQKKFNNPNIYPYPWGVDREPDMKLNLHITRFIEQKGRVYLDASWSLIESDKEKRISKLFSKTMKSQDDASSIVATMDRIFSLLEEKIALSIKNNI